MFVAIEGAASDKPSIYITLDKYSSLQNYCTQPSAKLTLKVKIGDEVEEYNVINIVPTNAESRKITSEIIGGELTGELERICVGTYEAYKYGAAVLAQSPAGKYWVVEIDGSKKAGGEWDVAYYELDDCLYVAETSGAHQYENYVCDVLKNLYDMDKISPLLQLKMLDRIMDFTTVFHHTPDEAYGLPKLTITEQEYEVITAARKEI